MSSFEVEEIFDDLKKGRISEMDAEWSLRRINGSSCMHSRIDSICRDVEYGRFDAYDARREFERAEMQCRRRSEEQEREDERWGY